MKKYINPEIEVMEVNVNDIITAIHFFMNEGYIPHFKMQAINVDESYIETYTDEELKLFLKNKCEKRSFAEYQCWVTPNFLFFNRC